MSRESAKPGSGDEERRYRAVLQLDGRVPGSLPLLLRWLGDPSWRVRAAAVERVARSDPRRAVPSLVSALGPAAGIALRGAAAAALARLGAPAVPALVSALGSGTPELRTAAAEILGDVGDRGAVPGLVPGLRDPDPNVRAAAADALGKIGGAEAVGALVAVLAERDAPLVRAALDGLSRLRAPVSAERLEELAQDPRLRRAALRLSGESDEGRALALVARGLEDASRAVREAAVAAVGRMRLRRSGPPHPWLVGAVRRIAACSADMEREAVAGLTAESVEARCGALSVLEWAGRPGHALAIAEAAAEGDERVRSLAVDALAALGAPGADELVAGMPGLAPGARIAALSALARLGDARAAPGLVAALASEDEALRGMALDALGRLGDPRAAADLGHLLRHADPGVARAAATALSELSERGTGRARIEARAEMSQEEFKLLRELVHDHCGLAFGEDARFLFENRLGARLRLLGVSGFGAYHRFLRHDPARRAELEAMVDALTVHETYLYREPLQLRAFSEEILPALAQENGPARRLRIWSAGCSTGEEVYTVAALLARSGLFEGWGLEVLGTDIARRVLAVARAGAYGPHAFRSAEAEAIRPWFRSEGGKWHARDVIRRMVRFEQMNLLDRRETRLAPAVDVVFCRNVMIYFDLAARRRLARTFGDKLREGGYLLLGHAESLLNVTADFELVQLRHDLVYRKPSVGQPIRA